VWLSTPILTGVRLLLIRHAKALPGEPDELRALSPKGRAAAQELGERLAAQGVKPTAILTSPLLRARETADALASTLGGLVETTEALAPGATADGIRAAVAGRGDTVIAVGHQPDCGQIAAALGDGVEPHFPTAGMVELQLEG
jgi:phosphohistidine phosphatase